MELDIAPAEPALICNSGSTAVARDRPVQPVLDAETERATRAFLKRFDGRYAVRDAILFGGRALCDHRPDSDADIAVILEGKKGDRYGVSGGLAGLEFHDQMETGVKVQGGRFGKTSLLIPKTS